MVKKLSKLATPVVINPSRDCGTIDITSEIHFARKQIFGRDPYDRDLDHVPLVIHTRHRPKYQIVALNISSESNPLNYRYFIQRHQLFYQVVRPVPTLVKLIFSNSLIILSRGWARSSHLLKESTNTSSILPFHTITTPYGTYKTTSNFW